MNYIKEAHKNTIIYALCNKAQGLVNESSESKNRDLFNKVVALGVATGAMAFACRVAYNYLDPDLGATHCEVKLLYDFKVDSYRLPSLLTNYTFTKISNGEGSLNNYNVCYSFKLPLLIAFIRVCVETLVSAVYLLPKAIAAGLTLSTIVLLAYLADLSVQIIFLVLSNQNLNTAEAKKD